MGSSCLSLSIWLDLRRLFYFVWMGARVAGEKWEICPFHLCGLLVGLAGEEAGLSLGIGVVVDVGMDRLLSQRCQVQQKFHKETLVMMMMMMTLWRVSSKDWNNI